ncbi:tRNA lysidine(34) synthetase TilS [Galactobacter valiniphilus]|uniref:tRNA lysidine(34) synthetase TilS n=1 Tax=Galactobacter valiniphilus TaxID=2676122 RepID=UPI00373570E0
MAKKRWPRGQHNSLTAAREAVRGHLPAGLGYLVAVSGGADSLALAATLGWALDEGLIDGPVGAVIVDHGLQLGSAEAAAEAAAACRELGLDPVIVERVEVEGHGEAAARTARYESLEAARERVGADFLLTAHTADDQAEQVLLGLARGSGTRSLAGIPARRARVLRPFLELRRSDTEAVCRAHGLSFWVDPTNASPEFLRNRVRHELLPALREVLGEGIDDALVRTARLAAQDAELLDRLAEELVEDAARASEPTVLGEAGDRVAGRAPLVWDLDRLLIRDAPAALRSRALRQAAVAVGGRAPSAERTAALERLVAGVGSAGPVQLDGRVSVTRERLGDGRAVVRFRGLA